MGFFRRLFGRPKSDSFSEKRLKPRLSCAISTELSDAWGNTWNCKIIDMSEGGLGITTSARLRMGSLVKIIKPAVSTEVVWALENKAGLRIVK